MLRKGRKGEGWRRRWQQQTARSGACRGGVLLRLVSDWAGLELKTRAAKAEVAPPPEAMMGAAPALLSTLL